MSSARPVLWVSFLIVVVGGAAGVALRAACVLPLPDDSHPIVVPAVTAGINIVGSFGLGVVTGLLGDRRPGLRLLLGTGLLGGFTTYSAFVVQTLQLFTDAPVVGLLLAAITVFGAVLAAGGGLLLASRREAAAT